MSPEIVGKQGYSTFVDLWSLGVTTFELLFGKVSKMIMVPCINLLSSTPFSGPLPETPQVKSLKLFYTMNLYSLTMLWSSLARIV
jgi:serine/threonine protein kinase